MYNEAASLVEMLQSVVNQSIKPAVVLMCDGGSTDGSVDLAEKILSNSGIHYLIVNVRRNPKIGKLNISLAYGTLSVLLKNQPCEIEYVATIEADAILE